MGTLPSVARHDMIILKSKIVNGHNLIKKKNKELNLSYIFASAKNFNESANEIVSGLEKNGFSRYDVINAQEKTDKYEFEISKIVKQDLFIPIMTFGEEPLEFSDLIGEDFELSKQNSEFEFKIHYDNDGRILLDIRKDDVWTKERQTTLNLTYKDKNFSKKELIEWLDNKLRFIMIDKKDKTKFMERVVD